MQITLQEIQQKARLFFDANELANNTPQEAYGSYRIYQDAQSKTTELFNALLDLANQDDCKHEV
jgi:hypothetical protein